MPPFEEMIAEQEMGKLPVEEKEGFTFGEWSAVENEVPLSHSELEVKSKMGTVSAITDFGGPKAKRKTSEDTFFVVAQDKHLSVGVIDGVGGILFGERATAIGAAVAQKRFRDGDDDIVRVMDHAHMRMTQYAHGGSACAVMARIGSEDDPRKVVIGSSGDCKAMTIRGGVKLEEGTTKFQNLAQRKIDEGQGKPEDYYNDPFVGTLTSALGASGEHLEEPLDIEFKSEQGDFIVMASDGLWDNVSEYEVTQLAKECKAAAELQQKLYDLAHQRNNADEPFTIQHSADKAVQKQLKKADNITIAVIELS